MARIRTVQTDGAIRVTVTGHLRAGDVGRLERACAPALTMRIPALEIDLRNVSDFDGTARAVLTRMADRGAHVAWPIETATHSG